MKVIPISKTSQDIDRQELLLENVFFLYHVLSELAKSCVLKLLNSYIHINILRVLDERYFNFYLFIFTFNN